jgi:hypothetical protein
MTARRVTTLLLTALVACVTPTESAQPVEPEASDEGCHLDGQRFIQSSPGPCGTSIWEFTRRDDGNYYVAERGCANATGTATYDGTTVVLDFKYGNGAGRYIWPLDGQCQGSPGNVHWSQGPLAGRSVPSTLAPTR